MKTMMRRLLLYIMFAMPLAAVAQDNNVLDVERFRSELREYVLAKVDFTIEEADTFFSLYYEMRDKERAVFADGAKIYKGMQMSEEECRAALMYYDESQVKLKQLQMVLHNQMLEVLPAKKVLMALRRCEKFNRDIYQKMSAKWHNDKQDKKQKEVVKDE